MPPKKGAAPKKRGRPPKAEATEAKGPKTGKRAKVSSSEAETAAVSEFGPGDRVRLQGLTGAAHLNGQSGVLEMLNSETQRWHVKLGSGEVKALRPENLSLLEAKVADETLDVIRKAREQAGVEISITNLSQDTAAEKASELVEKKLQVVYGALETSNEHVSASADCRMMLQAVCPHSLGIPQNVRSSNQEAVVGMIWEVYSTAKSNLEERIAKAQEVVDGFDPERAARGEAQKNTEDELEAKGQQYAETIKRNEDDMAALKEAKSALRDSIQKREDAENVHQALVRERDNCLEVQRCSLEVLRGSVIARSETGSITLVTSLFDKLFSGAKARREATPQQHIDALAEHLSSLSERLVSTAEAVAEKVTAVETAEGDLETIKENYEQSKNEVELLQAKCRWLEGALVNAQRSATEHLRTAAKSAGELSSMREALGQLQEVVDTVAFLRDRVEHPSERRIEELESLQMQKLQNEDYIGAHKISVELKQEKEILRLWKAQGAPASETLEVLREPKAPGSLTGETAEADAEVSVPSTSPNKGLTVSEILERAANDVAADAAASQTSLAVGEIIAKAAADCQADSAEATPGAAEAEEVARDDFDMAEEERVGAEAAESSPAPEEEEAEEPAGDDEMVVQGDGAEAAESTPAVEEEGVEETAGDDEMAVECDGAEGAQEIALDTEAVNKDVEMAESPDAADEVIPSSEVAMETQMEEESVKEDQVAHQEQEVFASPGTASASMADASPAASEAARSVEVGTPSKAEIASPESTPHQRLSAGGS